MAADPAMSRLLSRIEQNIGLDLRQRAGELGRWLRDRSGDAAPGALETFGERIASASSPERAELVDRFTVPHTRFFREAEQLAAVDFALTALARPVLHIWVAGCATGEEAYTVALLAAQRGRRVEIVGSDINTRSLAVARTGRYPRQVLSNIAPQHHGQFRESGESVTLAAGIRRMVRFVEHNLLDAPLAPESAAGWDLILCRNVLIYFRPELAVEILRRLAPTLVPGGYLMVGVSEFHLTSPGLVPARLAERALLQRPAQPPPPPPAPALPPPPPPAHDERGSVRAPAARLTLRLLPEQLDAVLEEALSALVRDPELQPALFVAGVAYHLKGRHLEAAALLERTLRQHPTCWPAAYFLALSEEALTHAEAALRAYQHLLKDAPPRPEAQALIDLLELQSWKNEALALAARRLAQAVAAAPRLQTTGAAEQSLSAHAPQRPHRRQ